MSDDLIRRADAIEVADAVWSVTGDKNVAKVWDQLKDLPSAQPERKKGKWIYYPKASGTATSTAVHLYPVCSECGAEHTIANYCPNCGVEMQKGGEDE